MEVEFSHLEIVILSASRIEESVQIACKVQEFV